MIKSISLKIGPGKAKTWTYTITVSDDSGESWSREGRLATNVNSGMDVLERAFGRGGEFVPVEDGETFVIDKYEMFPENHHKSVFSVVRTISIEYRGRNYVAKREVVGGLQIGDARAILDTSPEKRLAFKKLDDA